MMGDIMSMIDTFKYGNLYVDASMTIDILEDRDAFTGDSREALRAFEESGADFTFDPDWHGMGAGGFYAAESGQLPLILIGEFGGYPGEALDRANCDAAKAWAEGRDAVLVFSVMGHGCEYVSLWYDLSSLAANREDAQEAVDLAEGFMDYPVLDEVLMCQYECEVWEDMITEMIKDAEDEHGTITLEQNAKMWELAGEFYGYWEEGYFPQEKWDEIVDKVLNSEVQLHQNEELELIFTGKEV